MIFLNLLLVFITSVQTALVLQPNNIICFPKRDYCSITGFIDLTGKSLLVEVNRNGAIIGSASGIVSGSAIAFDINHPGGLCWGDGTTIKVTPDIQPGDLVTVKYGPLLLGDMTVSNGYITSYSLSGTTLLITGYVASSVISSNIEVRVVNPLMLNTVVAKRQVNAILGPLTPSVGYSSGLKIVGTSFTATFVFNTQDAANIAGSGSGYNMLMWQFTDVNGARQGLTISEYGEVGGPYSNICPYGSQNIGSPLVHAIAVSGNVVKWAPGKDIIGSAPTSAFSINVLRGNTVYGYRVPKTDNQVLFELTQIIPGDNIELRSMIGTKMSDSFVLIYQPLTLTPNISSVPVNNQVTEVKTEIVVLNSNTGQILYTLDNSPVIDSNNNISPSALLYYTPIPITQSLTLRAISFNTMGSFSPILIGKFGPPNAIAPQAVSNAPTVTIQTGGVMITWIKPNDLTITFYGVDVYTTAGVKVGITRNVFTNSLFISDLVAGTSYRFTITSNNGVVSSAPSPKSASVVFPVPVDAITIASARYVANKQFRVSGTGSVSAVVTVHYVNTDNTIGAPILIRGTTTAISAPITCAGGVCTYAIDVRNGNVPLTNPGRIFVKSSLGGIAQPVSLI